MTSSGGNTIHTFTSSGTFVVTAQSDSKFLIFFNK
jgi:hypothetical protein